MREAPGSLDRHAEALRSVPVWLFSSGGTDPDAEALLDKQKRHLEDVGARNHHVFGDSLDLSDLSFLERGIVKKAKTPDRTWTHLVSSLMDVASGSFRSKHAPDRLPRDLAYPRLRTHVRVPQPRPA